jgi:GDP-mannose 6-dehydrogenase
MGRIGAAFAVDENEIHEMAIPDTKLNLSSAYTRPGSPFGGSCLPKDVGAMQHLAALSSTNAPLMDSLLRSNEAQKRFQLNRVCATASPGSTVLMTGLTFKPSTDDIRNGPHLWLAAALIARGYRVSVFDPEIRISRLTGENLAQLVATLPTFRSWQCQNTTEQTPLTTSHSSTTIFTELRRRVSLKSICQRVAHGRSKNDRTE